MKYGFYQFLFLDWVLHILFSTRQKEHHCFVFGFESFWFFAISIVIKHAHRIHLSSMSES